MGDNDNADRLAGMNRRKFLAGIGAGAAASVAGCTTGQPASPTPREVTRTVQVTDTPTATPRAGGGGSDSLLFNPMGYTGADDLITRQRQMMDPEPRKPIVKKVLATIWRDAPSLVMFYDNLLNPVNENWEGWVPTVGGPMNPDSHLNVRQAGGDSGGRPIIGMDTAPDTLNVLSTSTAYSFQLLDSIYTYGTAIHPITQQFIPYGYESWELNPGNVGSSSPTIVATMRDDLVFNDGESVTAGDAKFSVDYIVEQEVAGSIAASQFSAVEEVTVDSPDGYTVNYFLSEKDNAWFTSILGQVFLPEHVWSGVSDYQKYTPRDSDEGIVGSGPFELSDFSWENWFELSLRDDGIWQTDADYLDYFDQGFPFVDGIRYEIFGSQTALEQAVIDKSVDALYTGSGVTVDKAVQAQQTDGVRVIESEDSGWSHTSFNVRRVPLDDPAFRQTLVMLLDDDWVINDLKQGIGGVEGSYVTPKPYAEWRPPEPADAGGSYEGISVPTLEFPGEAGTFQLGTSGIEAARSFLVDHSDAKHDYEFKEASAEGAAPPDNLVLHVNGELLNDAHTNNYGEAGQGPLEMSFNPPQEDVDEAQIAQRWVGALKRVGIPVVSQVQSFNSQIPKVYGQEDFDMYAMGWTSINVNNDHYSQLFGSPGADLGY